MSANSSGSGSGNGSGGGMSNGDLSYWEGLINSDPGLVLAQGQLGAQNAADIASRNAAIQRAIINFGSVPDLNSLANTLGLSQADVQGILGNDISTLTNENTQAGTSTQAQLAQANQDALLKMTNALNARGMLNSGETPYELNNQNTAYTRAQYDATQKLLDALSQYQAGYESAQQARANTLAQDYQDAANRVLQAYGTTSPPPPSPSAPSTPGASAPPSTPPVNTPYNPLAGISQYLHGYVAPPPRDARLRVV